MSNYVKQVGGDHYKILDPNYQVWDFVWEINADFLIGTAIKYIVRWDQEKNGTPHRIEDLEKAISYIEKRVGFEASNNQISRGASTSGALERFSRCNKLTAHQYAVLVLLTNWQTPVELQVPLQMLKAFVFHLKRNKKFNGEEEKEKKEKEKLVQEMEEAKRERNLGDYPE